MSGGDLTPVLRIRGAGYSGVNGEWAIDPDEPSRKGRPKYRLLGANGALIGPVLSFTGDDRGWMFWNCGTHNEWPYASYQQTPLPSEAGWKTKESCGKPPTPTLEWLGRDVAMPVAEEVAGVPGEPDLCAWYRAATAEAWGCCVVDRM